MQAKASAGPPQIIAVAFQFEGWRGFGLLSAGMRKSDALAPCCSTRETSASVVGVGLLAERSSTRTVTCMDSCVHVAGLGIPAFNNAAAMRPCWVIEAELASTGS